MKRKRSEFHYHKTLVNDKNGNVVNKPHPTYVWLDVVATLKITNNAGLTFTIFGA